MLRILQPEIAILAVPMEDIALNLLKKKKKAQISCTIDLRSWGLQDHDLEVCKKL